MLYVWSISILICLIWQCNVLNSFLPVIEWRRCESRSMKSRPYNGKTTAVAYRKTGQRPHIMDNKIRQNADNV